VLGEYDLREATTAMGRCMFYQQLDLQLETWRMRTEEQSTPQLCAKICARTIDNLKNPSQRNSFSESSVMLN